MPHRLARNKMLLIMVGGAAGTYLRYLVGKWVAAQPWGHGFPTGTLLINVSGCFLLGVMAALLLERLPPGYEDWYLLLGTGFCGGFTTFSTFELETYHLLRHGDGWLAVANVVASVVAGLVGVWLGVVLAHWMMPPK